MESYNDACAGLSRWVCPTCGRVPCDCNNMYNFKETTEKTKAAGEDEEINKKSARKYEPPVKTKKAYLVTLLNITEVADATGGVIFQKPKGKPMILYKAKNQEIKVNIGDMLIQQGNILDRKIEVISSNLIVDQETDEIVSQ